MVDGDRVNGELAGWAQCVETFDARSPQRGSASYRGLVDAVRDEIARSQHDSSWFALPVDDRTAVERMTRDVLAAVHDYLDANWSLR